MHLLRLKFLSYVISTVFSSIIFPSILFFYIEYGFPCVMLNAFIRGFIIFLGSDETFPKTDESSSSAAFLIFF